MEYRYTEVYVGIELTEEEISERMNEESVDRDRAIRELLSERAGDGFGPEETSYSEITEATDRGIEMTEETETIEVTEKPETGTDND